MALQKVPVGRTVALTLEQDDQLGNPMLHPPTLVTVPVWSQLDASVGALTIAPDGFSATFRALKKGSDTISVLTLVDPVPDVRYTAIADIAVV